MTTETRQATCEERIADQRDSRLRDLKLLLRAAGGEWPWHASEEKELQALGVEPDDGYYGDEAQERLYELPLDVETITTIKVLLSTGGPADGFEAQIDSDGQIIRIEYVFQDWGDGARRVLHGDDFDTAEQFIQTVAIVE